MVSWEGINRRQFPRVDYPCLVVVGDKKSGRNESNTILTHTENIGVGGICVSVKQAIEMFSVVQIELDLLDLKEHIRCSGKVIWSVQREHADKQKQKYYDIGVEFTDIKKDDQARLKEVIERLVKNLK